MKHLYAVVDHTVLECFYLGSKQANINYILISAFVIYKHHRPLLGLQLHCLRILQVVFCWHFFDLELL